MKTNLAMNGVIFLTTITLFNQVIRRNDKVKQKKLSIFTLSMLRKLKQIKVDFLFHTGHKQHPG